MEKLNLIVARSINGFIGVDGKIPWDLPEDLQFFKRTTVGHAAIMGRKTFESIGKALPQRTNIVMTRNPQYVADDCIVVNSVHEALTAARQRDASPFIIGGAEIYRLFMPLVTRMYVTTVFQVVAGDALASSFFLPVEPGWVIMDHVVHESGKMSWTTMERSA